MNRYNCFEKLHSPHNNVIQLQHKFTKVHDNSYAVPVLRENSIHQCKSFVIIKSGNSPKHVTAVFSSSQTNTQKYEDK